MNTGDNEAPSDTLRGQFNTTHWSAVVNAGKEDSPQAQAALAELCQTYWYPLYAFLRAKGRSPPDAEDMVQGFFTGFIEQPREKLGGVDPSKGRFRTFLLTCLKNFCESARVRSSAEKRGGRTTIVSINQESAEERYLSEPADTRSPDQIYDLRWADTVLAAARHSLESEMSAAGQIERFRVLEGFLHDKLPGQSHAEIARQLETTEGTIRNAVQRLRKRFGELIRMEIARTLRESTRAAVDTELAHLMEILEDRGAGHV